MSSRAEIFEIAKRNAVIMRVYASAFIHIDEYIGRGEGGQRESYNGSRIPYAHNECIMQVAKLASANGQN